MSTTIRERIGQGLDAEARYGDRHWGYRRPGGFLPFQFQIPLGGGAPGLAFPIGGYGSPFAFTLPLGGSPPAPVVAMPAMPVPVPVPVPTEPPVTVASADLPLYVPPIQAADEAEGESEAVSLGERLVAAAEAAGGEAQGFCGEPSRRRARRGPPRCLGPPHPGTLANRAVPFAFVPAMGAPA